MRENVHQREIAAPMPVLGTMLDRLGGPQDELWPGRVWPPMVLDRPLSVGAAGGHDGIRYGVVEYEPGRRVRFEFDPRCGLRGDHEFVLVPVTPAATRLRHVLRYRPHGRMRLLWPAVERLHDAVLEDLLDNAERAATGAVGHPARWPRSVRLLRRAVRHAG